MSWTVAGTTALVLTYEDASKKTAAFTIDLCTGKSARVTGPLPTLDAVLVPLDDGRVVAVGYTTSHLYEKGRFSVIPGSPDREAVLLPIFGRPGIVVTGASSYTGGEVPAYILELSTMKWAKAAPIPDAVQGVDSRLDMTKWGDHLLFVWLVTPGRGAYLFDARANTWKRVSEQGMPEPRKRPTIGAIGDKFLVYGGDSLSGDRRAPIDGAIYDAASDTWTSLPPSYPQPAIAGGITVFDGRELFVLGSERTGESFAVEPNMGAFRPLDIPHQPFVAERDHTGVETLPHVAPDGSLVYGRSVFDPVHNRNGRIVAKPGGASGDTLVAFDGWGETIYGPPDRSCRGSTRPCDPLPARPVGFKNIGKAARVRMTAISWNPPP